MHCTNWIDSSKKSTLGALALLLTISLVATPSSEASEETNWRVAAMCVRPVRWDKQHNYELLERYAREAAAGGARLVVTCEGFLDGYTANTNHLPDMTREQYFAVTEPLDGPWMRRIAQLAKELEIYLAVGFAERRGEKMYNSLAVYSPAGEIALHYSKTHTAGEAYNTPGTSLPVARTPIGDLGALICYDRRFPEVPRILALKGADLLIVPAYGTDGERNEALLRTRAWENSVWVVYVKQDQALIIRPSGRILARDRGLGDELVYADIDLSAGEGDRDILHRRSPEFYQEIVELQLKSDD